MSDNCSSGRLPGYQFFEVVFRLLACLLGADALPFGILTAGKIPSRVAMPHEICDCHPTNTGIVHDGRLGVPALVTLKRLPDDRRCELR